MRQNYSMGQRTLLKPLLFSPSREQKRPDARRPKILRQTAYLRDTSLSKDKGSAADGRFSSAAKIRRSREKPPGFPEPAPADRIWSTMNNTILMARILCCAKSVVRQRPEGGRLAEKVGDDQKDGHLLEKGENQLHGRALVSRKGDSSWPS
jgi:hypothetical protein